MMQWKTMLSLPMKWMSRCHPHSANSLSNPFHWHRPGLGGTDVADRGIQPD